jgi:hypothetical protein
MFTIHQARRRYFGIIAALALTVLAPVAVTVEEEVVVLAPVAAASVDETNAEDVRRTRALAAQRALRTGAIGSLQEEALFSLVAASTTAEQTRLLAAQRALRSPDLGSLQEEALTAVVEASSAEVAR